MGIGSGNSPTLGVIPVVILRLPLVAVLYESENVAVPVPLAVPVMAPVVAFKLAQEGSDPLDTDHVLAEQLDDVAVCEYADPAVAFGKLDVEIEHPVSPESSYVLTPSPGPHDEANHALVPSMLRVVLACDQ